MRAASLALLLPLAPLAPAGAQSLDDARLRVEDWATGLELPTCFDFVGDGELLVWEKELGRVQHVVDGVVVGTALDVDVSLSFSRGGLGLVTDPAFEQNGWVYLYYSATDGPDGGAWTENRVVRYTFDGSALEQRFGPIYSVGYDPAQYNATWHNSGVIRFGPDGMLYGQVGDLGRGYPNNPRVEQNTGAAASSRTGGIYRLTPAGEVPPDNPFAGAPDAALRQWYVYGFRNAFGMAFDPLTGDLWYSENGPIVYDELNRAEPGMNGGWLMLAGPDARDATYPENGDTPYDAADLVELPGSTYRDPEFSWLQPIGVAAICFLDSKRFPEDLQQTLLVGEAVNDQLYAFALTPDRRHVALSGPLADGVADDAAERDLNRLGTGFGTIPDLHVGPDGYLYLSDLYAGKIRRIRPVTDLVEPQELEVRQGVLRAGGLAELERSDDAALVLGAQGAEPEVARRELVLGFAVGDLPQRLELVVESRGNRERARQLLYVLDPTSGAWLALDERPLARTDQVVSIVEQADPGRWVDPLDGLVRVRVLQLAPTLAQRTQVGGTGAPEPPLFQTFLDQVRLLVTHP